MDVSDILIFFCSGEGKGDPGPDREGGVGFLLKIPGEGGGSLRGGGGWGEGRGGLDGRSRAIQIENR